MTEHFYAFADVIKATEGGTSQSSIKDVAKQLEIDIRFDPSPYMGHTRVMVKTENKRTLRKFARELGVA